MRESRKRRFAQELALLLVGMLMGSVMLTPVGAHITSFNHLKTKHFYTKKAADARFIDAGEKAASAGKADVAGNVMAATVPVGDSCAITASTGGVSATRTGNTCDVTFPRSVDACMVGATPLHPQGAIGGEAAIQKLGGATVKVGRFDSVGGTPTAGLFSIFAVCPT
jgi:hypothetical protein